MSHLGKILEKRLIDFYTNRKEQEDGITKQCMISQFNKIHEETYSRHLSSICDCIGTCLKSIAEDGEVSTILEFKVSSFKICGNVIEFPNGIPKTIIEYLIDDVKQFLMDENIRIGNNVNDFNSDTLKFGIYWNTDKTDQLCKVNKRAKFWDFPQKRELVDYEKLDPPIEYEFGGQERIIQKLK